MGIDVLFFQITLQAINIDPARYGLEDSLCSGSTSTWEPYLQVNIGQVADRTRFIYVDDREVCYMLLYCFWEGDGPGIPPGAQGCGES